MAIRDELIYFRVGLPDEDVWRLLQLCEEAHCTPTQMIAALVAGVLDDDFEAHQAPAGFSPEKPLH